MAAERVTEGDLDPSEWVHLLPKHAWDMSGEDLMREVRMAKEAAIGARIVQSARVKAYDEMETSTEDPKQLMPWEKPTTNVNGHQCGTCRHFDASLHTVLTGQCRRSPPHVRRGWPRIAHNDWCGQWKGISPPETATPGSSLTLWERQDRGYPLPAQD